MITILVTIVHVIACLLLIVVILVQGGRGQGLSGPSFSSGNVQSLFGTQAADFLTKATTVAAILFILTCIGLNFIETRKSKSLLEAGTQKAPIDMEAVKKALEKIKAEKAAAPTAAAGAAAVQETVAGAAETVKQETAEVVADAKASAAAAVAAPAPVVAPASPAASPSPQA